VTENDSTSTKGNDTTLLVLVVDRSGSMETIREDMEGGIASLLKQQAAEAGTMLVTLAQFDTEYELLCSALPVAELAPYRLVPRGGTALLDAIGRTIASVRESLADVAPEDRPAVVFAVVTEGLENSSVEWNRDKVMAAVKDRIEAGWDFTFLGADQDAIREGGRLGVDAGSSLRYGKSATGARMAMDSLSASVSRKRRGEARSVQYTEEERRSSAD
jgi:Mg-chelatase subunit ChlD